MKEEKKRKKELRKQLKQQKKELLELQKQHKNKQVDAYDSLVRSYELNGFDFQFLENVQPIGAVKFNRREIEKATGFETILHIHALPDEVSEMWLMNIFNNNDVVSVLDVRTANLTKVMNMVDKNIAEQYERMYRESNARLREQAMYTASELKQFALDFTLGNEIVKFIQIRISLSANSKEELHQKTSSLKGDLEMAGFQVCIFHGDMKEEWLTLFQPYKLQDVPSPKQEVLIQSKALGIAYPFHHVELKDPRGAYYGKTYTNGAVLWDPFHRDKHRKNFNIFVCGMMGSGKSVFSKKTLEDCLRRGHYVRIIDVSGEYRDIGEKYHAVIVDSFGKEGRINIFQVFNGQTDSTGTLIDHYASFQNHINQLSNTFAFLDSSFGDTETLLIQRMLVRFYVDCELWGGKDENGIYPEICSYSNEEYPLLEDFVYWLSTDSAYEVSGENFIKEHSKILNVAQHLLEDSGELFNGETIVNDFQNTPCVIYDISKMKNVKEGEKNAKLFSILSEMWSQALLRGRSQAEKVANREINKDDVQCTMIVIDECHNIINANSIFAVKQINKYQREARKIYGGIILATQSPREMLPEGMGGEQEVAIRQIFEFSSTRVTFQLDTAIIPTMKKMYGSSLSDYQYDNLPFKETGHAIMSLSNGQSFDFVVDYDKERDDRLYKGGV